MFIVKRELIKGVAEWTKDEHRQIKRHENNTQESNRVIYCTPVWASLSWMYTTRDHVLHDSPTVKQEILEGD